MKWMPSPRVFYTVCFILVVSIVGNIYFGYHHVWLLKEQRAEDPAAYPFLSPRIFSENQNDILINFLPLRKTIREATDRFGDSFSLYFEYLPSGTSLGIHEQKAFFAASLIKVPVVMAYYRQQEASGLSVDNDRIKLEAQDIDTDYGTLWRRGVGAEISYAEAVQLALIESDNTAAMALSHHIGQEYFDDVYEGLDIDFTKVNNRVIITTKQYASILKALYLSSILTKRSSSAILTYLTQTKLHDKLPAGVPVGVTVAHKFGVYEDGNIYQDCGIVYVPKRPYILCMASESSEDEARTRMVHMSSQIYDYVAHANQ